VASLGCSFNPIVESAAVNATLRVNTNMNFFSGFQWAVPTAFSDSVSKAWFMEGDVLYDHISAYNSDWSAAINDVVHTIQVRSPARAGSTVDQSAREVFARNWDSEVKIELFTHMKKVSPVQITTTQGRLYIALWKGSLNTLYPDQTSKPSMPILAQQVSKNLEQLTAVASTFAESHPTFAMVRDLSNSVLRDKFQKILTAIRPHMMTDPITLTPTAAKFQDAETIAPTVEVALFPTVGIDLEHLENLVKKAVYLPGKDAKKDMFRLSAHGVLV